MKYLYMKKVVFLISIATIWVATQACEDFVTVDPPSTEIIGPAVFEDEATAKAAMNGIYSRMMENDLTFTSGIRSITTLAGLSADEFLNYEPGSTNERFNTNALTGNDALILWQSLYNTIYMSNAVIEGVNNSDNLNSSVSDQLLGEALFVRTWIHLYLTNLFGDIPYVTTTDYRVNNILSRLPRKEVMANAINDANAARMLLKDKNTDTKSRPNEWAATALLARLYLYNEQWTEAESMASSLIDNSDIVFESDLSAVFLPTSDESIWHIKPVATGFTFDAVTYILNGIPSRLSLTNELLDAFELNDARRNQWIATVTVQGVTYAYPYKYKIKNVGMGSEYLIALRLTEQFLIRAEARARQNKLAEAENDLNKIRVRANLTQLNGLSQATLMDAIEQERRTELFCEWGHRWFDLIRLNRANTVLANKADWQPNDILYPVPDNELKNNTNLLPQNPGY